MSPEDVYDMPITRRKRMMTWMRRVAELEMEAIKNKESGSLSLSYADLVDIWLHRALPNIPKEEESEEDE